MFCITSSSVQLRVAHQTPRRRPTSLGATRTRGGQDTSFGRFQDERVPPPPPPPPPPIFSSSAADPGSSPLSGESPLSGNKVFGVLIAGLVALAFAYGFSYDDEEELRESRGLTPSEYLEYLAEDVPVANNDYNFPSTVLPGSLPFGMESKWENRWRYDGNGQPFVDINGRWWRLERRASSRLSVTFYDCQNTARPNLRYVYTAPPEWPLSEIDLTNQDTMAMLFGSDPELMDKLQLLE